MNKLTDRVRNIFDEQLGPSLGDRYERREGQAAMADDVARAIESRCVLVAEAETGIGKSLAYLIPILEHCNATGTRAVISTHTRNLQRQLVESDYPIARSIVSGDCDAAVLMGRSNYLCKKAVKKLLQSERRDLSKGQWFRGLLLDASGEIDSLPGASTYLNADVRRQIAAPHVDAVCRGCHLRDECYLIRARKEAISANVVFVNHALLFSDLQASSALLGPYDVLVIDESHHLEDAATSFLSLSYTPRSIAGSWESIYTPELEETVAYARAMVPFDESEEIDRAWKCFHSAMASADMATHLLFDQMGENARRHRSDKDRRHVSTNSRVVYAEGDATPIYD